jgi:hypothetical protein
MVVLLKGEELFLDREDLYWILQAIYYISIFAWPAALFFMFYSVYLNYKLKEMLKKNCEK